MQIAFPILPTVTTNNVPRECQMSLGVERGNHLRLRTTGVNVDVRVYQRITHMELVPHAQMGQMEGKRSRGYFPSILQEDLTHAMGPGEDSLKEGASES